MNTIDVVFTKELEQLGAEIEEKVVTGCTLADAIRLGAGVTDQAVGSFGSSGQSCAMTAAAIAVRAMQEK